jgi:hypothetical protein
MFDEYFSQQDKKKFIGLLQSENAQDALDFYFGIAKGIASEKWLPENFAKNQAIDILMKYYLTELR